jgi:tetratricopeptide (TPR) repeat protein
LGLKFKVSKQILLTGGGLILLAALLFFGRTETKKAPLADILKPTTPTFNVIEFISNAKGRLTAAQGIYISKLENNISRGDVKTQQGEQYLQLASFWKDSANAFVPYAYYLAEASKLDNSEKKLTFAAQLLLDSMRTQEDPALKSWEAETSAELFEKALILDPENDNLRIGLGSCYVFGKGMAGDASETMKGIQQLLQVVRKDSGNMRAQLVLGIGGVISRQYDKAIERLKKVVAFDGKNLEAVSWLADAYAAKGDKEEAIHWYQYSKKLLDNPDFWKAVDERIKELQ